MFELLAVIGGTILFIALLFSVGKVVDMEMKSRERKRIDRIEEEQLRRRMELDKKERQRKELEKIRAEARELLRESKYNGATIVKGGVGNQNISQFQSKNTTQRMQNNSRPKKITTVPMRNPNRNRNAFTSNTNIHNHTYYYEDDSHRNSYSNDCSSSYDSGSSDSGGGSCD